MKKLTWKEIKKNCEKGIPMCVEQIPKKYLSKKRRIHGVVTFEEPLKEEEM